jgi:site-specific DNA-methyltransferase (adenine-specific)
MEYMATLPDKAFDLAVVDPPYAVDANDGSFGRGGIKSIVKTYRKELHKYANANKVPDKEYFTNLFRVSKNQIIWGANYYPEHLHHSGWIVWDKKKSDGLLSMGELAFQSFDKKIIFFRHEWEGFRKGCGSFGQYENKTIHPNQKPLSLYQWLLQNYANPGQRILDTHLGSGSSAIAAHYFGCDFVGCEIDIDYFNAARERFDRETRQVAMW